MTCVKPVSIYKNYSAPTFSGFRHVMMANLIRSFLNPSIINGIAKAPLMVFNPGQKKKLNNYHQVISLSHLCYNKIIINDT